MNVNKKFTMNHVLLILAVGCITLTSCVKDVTPSKPVEPSEEYNKFDFSTKKQVEFTLQYNVKAGYNVQFEMYSTSPLTVDEFKSYIKDTTLIPFLSGRTDENGKVYFKGELPATVNEIYSYSTGIGVPVLMKATVSS